MFTLNVFFGRELSKLPDASSLSISLNLSLYTAEKDYFLRISLLYSLFNDLHLFLD